MADLERVRDILARMKQEGIGFVSISNLRCPQCQGEPQPEIGRQCPIDDNCCTCCDVCAAKCRDFRDSLCTKCGLAAGECPCVGGPWGFDAPHPGTIADAGAIQDEFPDTPRPSGGSRGLLSAPEAIIGSGSTLAIQGPAGDWMPTAVAVASEVKLLPGRLPFERHQVYPTAEELAAFARGEIRFSFEMVCENFAALKLELEKLSVPVPTDLEIAEAALHTDGAEEKPTE